MDNMSSGMINYTSKNEVIYTHRFTLDVGRLLRGPLINFFDTQRFLDQDLKISYTENKGWLSSVFFVEMVGPLEKLRHITNQIQAWIDHESK